MRRIEDETAKLNWQLNAIKIGLVVMVVVFVHNAILYTSAPEAFPVTRWGMYSGASEPPLQSTQYTIEVIDIDDNTHDVSSSDLFRSTGVSKSGSVGQKVLFDAIDFYGANMPERQSTAQRRVVARLEEDLGIAVAEVRVWKSVYDVNLYDLPHITSEPIESIMIGSFTAQVAE